MRKTVLASFDSRRASPRRGAKLPCDSGQRGRVSATISFFGGSQKLTVATGAALYSQRRPAVRLSLRQGCQVSSAQRDTSLTTVEARCGSAVAIQRLRL